LYAGEEELCPDCRTEDEREQREKQKEEKPGNR